MGGRAEYAKLMRKEAKKFTLKGDRQSMEMRWKEADEFERVFMCCRESCERKSMSYCSHHYERRQVHLKGVLRKERGPNMAAWFRIRIYSINFTVCFVVESPAIYRLQTFGR